MIQTATMKARLIDHENPEPDLEVIRRWWEAHGHPEIPREALPKVGIIIEDEESPLSVGWIYECNSAPVAWVAWLTTNPDNSPFTSRRAIGLLIDFMVHEASENGYVILTSTCREGPLGRCLQSSGFVRSDGNVAHAMYMRIATEEHH